MAADPRQEIVSTGAYLINHQLAWGSTGNISARFDETSFFISATGATLGALSQETIALCRTTGEPLVQTVTPSKEHRVHAAIYTSDPKAKAVIHTAPPYITLTAAACEEFQLEVGYFIESAVLLQKLSWIPFHLPGSPELEQAVREAAKTSDVMMLKNHGVIVSAESMRKALIKVDTLEFLCRMIITAKAAGIKLVGMENDSVRKLLEDPRYIR